MKLKRQLGGIAAGSLLALASVQTGWSIPTLQLDIVGGTYVGGAESSTISSGPIFDLQALVTSGYLAADPNRTYFLSAAIVPKTTVPLAENFGSFTINGITYDASHGMQWGTPPLDEVNSTFGDLAPHGIYSTHYAEVAFTFAGSDLINAYNVQDDSSAKGTLNAKTFAVDVSGLAAGYQLHFDLYNTEYLRKKALNIEAIDDFAPFSHDAQSGTTTTVPDAGSTMVLLGLALAGLGAARCCRSKQAC